ncbi:MAG: NAD(P)H-dependent oxidoreductase subunit E, partial [Planctomycetes bacterium]|nr:NAD(P)H-dependent oxidoreductase subunit E [Planctomycetota bacterium]
MSANLIALQNKFLGHGETVYDLLSKLHDQQGYIGDEDIERLAKEHNLPPQHLRATAKFYENLSQSQPAKHVVKLCNGEACRCEGFADRERTLQASLGVSNSHEVSSKGVRLEHVTCLGLCGLGPNAMVDGKVVSMADDTSLQAIVDAVHEKAPLALETPTNTLHFPAEGEPCIVLRNMKQDLRTLAAAKGAGV